MLLALVTFSALVVNGSGEPVDGVFVAPAEGRLASTGEDGRVAGTTQSPRLAFRKAEYRAVIVAPAEGILIVLERAGQAPLGPCASRRRDRTRFQLPGARGGARFRDIDYSGVAYSIKTATGKHRLEHGYGPMWSQGAPVARWLEQSTAYTETTYAGDVSNITAGRGTLPGGIHWRFLGMSGETISYATKDPAAARQFDAWLDRACLNPP